MSDLMGPQPSQDDGGFGTGASSAPAPRPPRGGGGGGYRGGGQGGDAGRYAQDVHSVTIHARQRTFYIDLKQSGNGKFFKISEKSRGGQKTTIMFDSEDLDKFVEALQEMKTKMNG